ncbi:hypothetical protein JQC67_13255 [Aurantibacter crassamenti]|uniref:hypothetical protein n=1 Tax=Aurantibacter crassamenti TaxID=1837375 RepID=UPI00193A6878|nr:hypothetical protein [Aurantibacter crassamenti]MBM1107114.1 hypothetical protein [Aurantibacter crassamenti]
MKAMFIRKSLLILGAITIFVSCSDDDKNVVVEEQQLNKTDVKTILETDSYTKSFDNIISEVYINNGSSGKNTECYVSEYSETGFTIEFDNCTINGTENVTGTLSAVYTSTENEIAYTVTWNDFSFGGTLIDGTRSYTINSDGEESIGFSATSNIEVTLADGSIIKETGTKEITFTFGSSLETSIYTLSGEWNVVADGHTYIVNVDDVVEGNLSCAYLNKGTMSVSKSGLIVDVDFGDGECDDIAKVIYPNGDEKEISLDD